MGGILDMITGESNRKAAAAANKAASSQKAVNDRMVKLFDLVLSKVKAADAGGQFDPTRQIQLANQSSAYQEDAARTNSAAIALATGRRPGDSEPSLQDRDLALTYQLQRRAQDQAIRQNAFSSMLGAYNAASSGANLPAASQGYAQQQQMALNQMTDPSAFWRTAMQFYSLSKKDK